MEEYIRLEEEKARQHGKVYNWETVKYGKIWYDEDVHDLRSVETEFPAIVFNDELSSEKTLSCEPTVSSLNNNEIDFRISFDESDDEDYMVSCFDDLDFFKDYENEFPAIVYNDALTSKSDFLTEPTLCPQHIDEFNLKYETSLSEYDEVEQNVLYFNDLFPFNIIYPGDLKSDMALPPRDQRHLYLRFEGLQYTDAYIANFEIRLAKIYRREVHRVQVFDFGGLTELMDKGLRGRMLMEHRDAQGQNSEKDYIEQSKWRLLYLVYTRDPMLRLCHRYLRLFALGRKKGAMISGGQFVAPLGPERQSDATAGALKAAEDAPVADEGALAIPAPVQAPLPPPPVAGLAQTMAQRLVRVEEDVHKIRGTLGEQREILDSMARDFPRFSTWTVVGLSQMMIQAGVRYTSYADFQILYVRRTRRRTDGASTSTAQQD
ncbi:hypothetical protein Tco_1327821 [Tanacetum coccineum]